MREFEIASSLVTPKLNDLWCRQQKHDLCEEFVNLPERVGRAPLNGYDCMAWPDFRPTRLALIKEYLMAM
jgi:hypothetical protein